MRELMRQDNERRIPEPLQGRVLQIGLGFDASELRRFHEAIHQRRHLGTPARARAVVVLAPQCPPQRAYDGAVVTGPV